MTHIQPRSIATSPEPPRAVHDEWGIYDPEQAGLEAVLRRVAAKHTVAVANAAQSPASTK